MQNKKSYDPGMAWLLHSKKFKENSAICTILTEKKGKLSVLINGTNSKKKRALLSPFQGLWLEYQDTGSLKKVTALESCNINFRLYGTNSICGLYLNELLIKTLPEEESVTAITNAYCSCLQKMCNDKKPAHALRSFEMILLTEIGYGLPFDQIQSSNKQNFLYCYEGGFVEVDQPQENSFAKNHLEKIIAQEWQDPIVNNIAKKLFRQAMQPVLNYKPLKCKELFQDIVLA